MADAVSSTPGNTPSFATQVLNLGPDWGVGRQRSRHPALPFRCARCGEWPYVRSVGRRRGAFRVGILGACKGG